MDAAGVVFPQKVLLEQCASMKVLYLSEWYPNRYDSSSGRFVRAHAIGAARQGVDLCVLFLHPIQQGDLPLLRTEYTDGVTEIYSYYSGSYLLALRRAWHYVRQTWGMPDLCQLNILTKNAVLPLWLRWRYNIPYIVVEHWSGYYPQVAAFKGFIHCSLARLAVRYARTVLTVSSELAQNMQCLGLHHPDYRLVRNIVFDDFFQLQPRKADGVKRILHISFFTDAVKNESDILRAIKLVSEQRQDFELVMIGKGDDENKLHALCSELSIPARLVRWTGELQPQEVCNWFYQSDFFVFYSNFETAGIVLTESLVCGKPIITTPVGIAPDIINEQTGMLVSKQAPQQLAQAILYMLDHYEQYDAQLLRQIGEQYSMQNVGKYLKDVYDSACS